MNPGILDLSGPVVFVPVRHHSPACAHMVRDLAAQLRPAVILIEGPSDFNARLNELTLPHRLPIAIYSYVRRADGERRGAYYPFCRYSPEWQAIRTAQALGIPFAFIDLPWAAMVETGAETPEEELTAQRYADGELRRSGYVAALCRKLGVEEFDALWDTLFEINPDPPAALRERCHHFCYAIREADAPIPASDLRREAFMASQIRKALAQYGNGPVLVVTGGFHSHALYERVMDGAVEDEAEAFSTSLSALPAQGAASGMQSGSPPLELGEEASFPSVEGERGIALTPYTYERLDSLTGYEAGMPSPGFYDAAWQQRDPDSAPNVTATYRALLVDVTRALRERKQAVSAADLIAVETMARGLATLRGHAEVWRTDLIDGLRAALVKDELALGEPHPFLDALYAALRGRARGVLAEGTPLPPLARDILNRLEQHDLVAENAERSVELDLRKPEDRERSRVLHGLRLLQLPGYRRSAGVDFAARDDLSRLTETWTLRWTPGFDGGCIEAALYGPTLPDAASACLAERAGREERDAEVAALALLDACMIGAVHLTGPFRARLVELVRGESDFFRLARALGHLLYLYRYDEVLDVAADAEVGALLTEAFERGVWLFEGLGRTEGRERELGLGLRTLVETFERCAGRLPLSRTGLVEALQRTSAAVAQSPFTRGAAAGALWSLGEAETESLTAQMTGFADPERLGDYLAGLFALAREAAQRQPELVLRIDDLLMGYDDEAFLRALPPLRLAFSFFAPREKHYLARTLLEARGEAEAAPLPALEVDAEMAARALAWEVRLFATLTAYSIRGGDRR